MVAFRRLQDTESSVQVIIAGSVNWSALTPGNASQAIRIVLTGPNAANVPVVFRRCVSAL